MSVKINRDEVRDGDVFYFEGDPHYIYWYSSIDYSSLDGDHWGFKFGEEDPIPWRYIRHSDNDESHALIVVHNVSDEGRPGL